MKAAIAIGARGLGGVWPNPAVGCLVVRDNQVIARGWTQPQGRPHAEVEALNRAGNLARGATVYISLEPCSHFGQTAPCCDALIKAGIRRAVIAMLDPDTRVNGRGVSALENAGINVVTGVEKALAGEINAGFISRVTSGRPLVTLKLATSADGKIATKSGASKWITGSLSRSHGHRLRSIHDAILVGAGTLRCDDPQLTCRLPGLEGRSPVRVIVDSDLSISLTNRVIKSAVTTPTWVVTVFGSDVNQRKALSSIGVKIIDVEPGEDGKPNLDLALKKLGELGITRLLVEGGSKISAAMVGAKLVDRVVLFRAPIFIGGDGISALSGFGVESLADAASLRLMEVCRVGSDIKEVYAVDR